MQLTVGRPIWWLAESGLVKDKRWTEREKRERETESLHAGDCLRPTPQTKQSKAQLACGGVATAAPFGCVEEEKGRDRERERVLERAGGADIAAPPCLC